MKQDSKLVAIIELLNTYRDRIPYHDWCASVRGWGIYFQRANNQFDIIEFYKAVGYY